jgi:hypothetical protein
LTLFPWAQFRQRKSAVTLHTLLDVRGRIPISVYVTGGLTRKFIAFCLIVELAQKNGQWL